LIIFLPEIKFVSFRCLVNIKLRQQQLVNCKIYENKNGLIFDEASIKRDLIVHRLFMNFGEQFILFLPFRAAPESCGAELPLVVGLAGVPPSQGLVSSLAAHGQGASPPVLSGHRPPLPTANLLSLPAVWAQARGQPLCCLQRGGTAGDTELSRLHPQCCASLCHSLVRTERDSDGRTLLRR